jgi:hypothetical protein
MTIDVGNSRIKSVLIEYVKKRIFKVSSRKTRWLPPLDIVLTLN